MSNKCTVTSEVHQDLMFFQMIQPRLFSDKEEDDDEEDDSEIDKEVQNYEATKRISTAFNINGFRDKPIEIVIDNFRSTDVSSVGLQVWRGALLLADFILANPSLFKKKRILELASGTGITSVVAALVGASSVVASDIDHGEILDLIRCNLEQNVQFYPEECQTKVLEIDFFKTDWREGDEVTQVSDVDVLLAADVVYDREITEKFFETLNYFIKHHHNNNRKLTILIAIEKREQIDESGEKVAPNFVHFSNLLKRLVSENVIEWTLEKLKLDFKQHFDSYQRVNELNLWKLHNN